MRLTTCIYCFGVRHRGGRLVACLESIGRVTQRTGRALRLLRVVLQAATTTGDGNGDATELGAIEILERVEQGFFGLELDGTLAIAVNIGVAHSTSRAEVVLEISPVSAAREAIDDETELGAVRATAMSIRGEWLEVIYGAAKRR